MKFICGLLALATISFAAEKPADKVVTIDDPRTVVAGERSVVPINVCQFQETLLILPAAEKVMNPSWATA